MREYYYFIFSASGRILHGGYKQEGVYFYLQTYGEFIGQYSIGGCKCVSAIFILPCKKRRLRHGEYL